MFAGDSPSGRTVSDEPALANESTCRNLELRAKFAAALSRMYGAEVPAYTTLVEVSAEVNRDYAHTDRMRSDSARWTGSTAERHGAIRVGSPRTGRRG